MPKAWGPTVGFCTFKASKRQPDVAQPQLTTTTFFSSCIELAYNHVIATIHKIRNVKLLTQLPLPLTSTPFSKCTLTSSSRPSPAASHSL